MQLSVLAEQCFQTATHCHICEEETTATLQGNIEVPLITTTIEILSLPHAHH